MGPFEMSGVLFVVMNLVLGGAFGVALERSGFGDSRRIAAQFLLTDLTVLKVMFTAILVAMLLLFWSSAIGIINMDHVYISATHLSPGIIGGALLGVGMVIGGYCPGTGLVAASTLKLDGMVFLAGLAAGIFIFGENVPAFWDFYQESGAMGAVTIDSWFGISKGMAVLLVTGLALSAFWGVGTFERAQGSGVAPSPKLRAAAGAAVVASLGLLLIPQPGLDTKIQRMAHELDAQLANREVQIDPAELIDLMHNNQVKLVLLDLRSEADFNQFHLLDAKCVSVADLREGMPASFDPISIVIAMSNDEASATEAFRILRAQGVAGAYLLEGGINGWLEIYGHVAEVRPEPRAKPNATDTEPMRFAFPAALGDRVDIAWPDPHKLHLPKREFTKKAKSLKPMVLSGGGCG